MNRPVLNELNKTEGKLKHKYTASEDEYLLWHCVEDYYFKVNKQTYK